jgi:hypothetical protein
MPLSKRKFPDQTWPDLKNIANYFNIDIIARTEAWAILIPIPVHSGLSRKKGKNTSPVIILSGTFQGIAKGIPV